MANTTTVQIPAEVNNFYDRNLLYIAYPLFVHNRWADVRDIPRNSGTQTIKFRRYTKLSAATTALTEGVTPASTALAITDITAVAKPYGAYVTITDEVSYQSQDPVLMEAGNLLGRQAADTLDQLCRDVILAGTNVYYGGTATSRVTVAAGDKITTTMLDKVIRLLEQGDTLKMTSMISPDSGYNTSPINSGYIAIVGPEVKFTLMGLTGFISVEKYANKANVMDGEIGAYKDIRFIATTNDKVFSGAGAAGIDVYSILIMGQHAYAQTRISGESMKNVIKPFGAGEDPLNQRATSGWKATYVAKILNDDFLVRLEIAST